MTQNPLLNLSMIDHNIDFSLLKPEHFKEAFDILIPQAKADHEYHMTQAALELDNLLETSKIFQQLSAVIHYLGHLNSVVETAENTAVYEQYIPQISALYTEIGLDKRGYDRYVAFKNSEKFNSIPILKQKIINQIIENYELGGINLPDEQKKRLEEISVSLSQISHKFSHNLLSAEAQLNVELTQQEIEGIPQRVLNNAEKLENGHYLIKKSSGIYSDILTYADIESARKKIYENNLLLGISNEYDNTSLLSEIVKLKHEKAQVLGFKTYAHLALNKKMVKDPNKALAFINDLSEKSIEAAREDSKKVNEYGYQLMSKQVDFHDRAYVIEKMRQNLLDVNHEAIRKYFPVKKVVNSLLDIIKELYSIEFIENKDAKKWHPDVIVYDLYDKEGKTGSLYMDLYKRAHKSSGAWMHPVISRHVNKEGTRLPLAYIVCNAPKDIGQEPTFEFDEIVTLFHEMGHALHHLLTKVDDEYYSGLSNVQHDAVELPSQFMENFCWDYSVLKKLSEHIETQEKLPEDEFEKMKKAKNFLAASAMLRQANFSEIDMRIYSDINADPIAIEKMVFSKWATKQLDERSLFLPTFSHIFSGGYSAGYYGYKWAEVLSADAFAALKEAGDTYMEQKEVANKFRQHILASGGYHDMNTNFIAFRGREPDVKYLLIDNGIIK